MRAADAVVAAIDQAALAIFLAQKCGEEGPGAAARKKGGTGGEGGARRCRQATGLGRSKLQAAVQHGALLTCAPQPKQHTSCRCSSLCIQAEMEERKAALIEALAAKCGALLELQTVGGKASTAAGADKPSTAAGALAAAAGGEAPPASGAAAAPGDAGTGASVAGDAAGAGAFEAAFRELRKWVDTAADEKVRLLCWARCRMVTAG